MRLINLYMISLFYSLGLLGQTKEKVLVCYGKFDVNVVKNYDLIILEAAHFNYTEIQKLKKTNKKVVAYISLGEISETSKYYKFLKNKTLGRNNNWKSHFLDLNSTKTIEYLNSTIKNLIFMGYDGLFLDNIDNYTSFGEQFSQQNKLLEFIANLRKQYPNAYFIQNAGLEIVEKTCKNINLVVVESVVSNFSFDDNKYKLRDETEYLNYFNTINSLIIKTKLPFVLIEYSNSKKLTNAIKKILLKTKYSYFISDITLQKIP